MTANANISSGWSLGGIFRALGRAMSLETALPEHASVSLSLSSLELDLCPDTLLTMLRWSLASTPLPACEELVPTDGFVTSFCLLEEDGLEIARGVPTETEALSLSVRGFVWNVRSWTNFSPLLFLRFLLALILSGCFFLRMHKAGDFMSWKPSRISGASHRYPFPCTCLMFVIAMCALFPSAQTSDAMCGSPICARRIGQRVAEYCIDGRLLAG